MALGAVTFISASDSGNVRTLRFSMPLTSGANHVEAGSTLDLSQATLGAHRGFHVQVDGVKHVGWLTAGSDPTAQSDYQFNYVRAAAGAPATGLLKVDRFSTSTGATTALVAAGDLSALVGVFEATGR